MCSLHAHEKKTCLVSFTYTIHGWTFDLDPSPTDNIRGELKILWIFLKEQFSLVSGASLRRLFTGFSSPQLGLPPPHPILHHCSCAPEG